MLLNASAHASERGRATSRSHRGKSVSFEQRVSFAAPGETRRGGSFHQAGKRRAGISDQGRQAQHPRQDVE
jgi:hypothetical protein